MTAHTPGPWTFRDASGAGLEICGPVSALHGVDLPRGMPEVISFFQLASPQNVLVACERWVQFEPKGWHEMQVANARLIAAAPDLLASLREYVRDFGDNDDPDSRRMRAKASAAIAKAEGT